MFTPNPHQTAVSQRRVLPAQTGPSAAKGRTPALGGLRLGPRLPESIRSSHIHICRSDRAAAHEKPCWAQCLSATAGSADSRHRSRGDERAASLPPKRRCPSATSRRRRHLRLPSLGSTARRQPHPRVPARPLSASASARDTTAAQEGARRREAVRRARPSLTEGAAEASASPTAAAAAAAAASLQVGDCPPPPPAPPSGNVLPSAASRPRRPLPDIEGARLSDTHRRARLRWRRKPASARTARAAAREAACAQRRRH